jgi:hypothetical protein
VRRRDCDPVAGDYGRRTRNRMLGIDRRGGMVADGGRKKYFRVMNSVMNRGGGIEMITVLQSRLLGNPCPIYRQRKFRMRYISKTTE